MSRVAIAASIGLGMGIGRFFEFEDGQSEANDDDGPVEEIVDEIVDPDPSLDIDPEDDGLLT